MTREAAVVALRRLADRVEDAEVERALRAGWTWSQVAEALGVTRQAVHKKHVKRLAHGSATVEAEHLLLVVAADETPPSVVYWPRGATA